MHNIVGKILVVDDNRLNRLKLGRGLENHGHQIALAENGIQALDMLKESLYDLILLDILMPEMDGYQVLEKLKADEELREIPVIVISAIDEMPSIIRCVEMGAEDYLPKPFDAVLLKARIGAALEKKQLRDKERLYTKSMERDLEIGRQIQSSFFPETLPQVSGWEIAVRFQAARQVSGDFYDVFLLDDDSGLGFVIADVCDKGVGAALFMGLFRSLIRAFAELYYGKTIFDLSGTVTGSGAKDHPIKNSIAEYDHVPALETILTYTNNYIATNHGKANMFATMFFGIIEPENGMLFYVNAGHESVAVVTPNGIRHLLTATSPAVGLMPDLNFIAHKIEINPGDLLVAFTDGVTEAKGAENKLYGEDKLMQLLNEPVSSADDMLRRIMEDLRIHTKGMEQSDDITMLAIRRI